MALGDCPAAHKHTGAAPKPQDGKPGENGQLHTERGARAARGRCVMVGSGMGESHLSAVQNWFARGVAGAWLVAPDPARREAEGAGYPEVPFPSARLPWQPPEPQRLALRVGPPPAAAPLVPWHSLAGEALGRGRPFPHLLATEMLLSLRQDTAGVAGKAEGQVVWWQAAGLQLGMAGPAGSGTPVWNSPVCSGSWHAGRVQRLVAVVAMELNTPSHGNLTHPGFPRPTVHPAFTTPWEAILHLGRPQLQGQCRTRRDQSDGNRETGRQARHTGAPATWRPDISFHSKFAKMVLK